MGNSIAWKMKVYMPEAKVEDGYAHQERLNQVRSPTSENFPGEVIPPLRGPHKNLTLWSYKNDSVSSNTSCT